MIAQRRTRANFALQRAVQCATQWRRPLIVLEALRCDYRWNCDRIHQFIVDGMRDNAAACAAARVTYYPFLEPRKRAGAGLLDVLARRACIVVTDEFPCFFLPRMIAAAGAALDVRLEAVDSNGLLPLRAAASTFPTAYAFRRFLQKTLRPHLLAFPDEDPLAAAAELPALSAEALAPLQRRWPPADLSAFDPAAFPIDHSVGAAPLRGGTAAGRLVLSEFVQRKLDRYGEDRNEPEKDGGSGLSPYLHFGHVGVHEVFSAIAKRERWSPERLSEKAGGRREGWWGMSPAAESFLDEAITWRELGYNACTFDENYDRYEGLPDWARRTLDAHAADPRRWLYTPAQFERGATHDRLWNAAQNQLVREGRMHNYLRMLWGKKILEWSESPRAALDILIELNNKYALDGRNPNSYTGIAWVLGRYDRPWAPERPIFGVIRYMSSENTARKFSVRGYIERYAPQAESLF